MRRITWLDRLRYRFDSSMSRGPIALIAWISLVTLIFIVVMTLLLGVLQTVGQDSADGARPFYLVFWTALLHVLDPGTLGNSEGDWSYLLALLVVTLGGILIVSGLIGILTAGIQVRLEQLRKGRSLVIESGHTLILGWSPQIFTVISELVLANANQRRPAIVIVANRDKVEMEDAIEAAVGDTRNTRVICRTGSPTDPRDVLIGRPETARSIIVLSPPESNDPDALVIKTVLALVRAPQRREAAYHLVVELRDRENLEVLRLVGGDEVSIVQMGDLIARIAVSASRSSGLSVVYTELLDMDGDEIYEQYEPKLVGRSFEDAVMAYETSAVIGLERDGKVVLNPPADHLLHPGERIIAISRDDDTIVLTGQPGQVQAEAIREGRHALPEPERTLVLGWNEGAEVVIRELDAYVAPGSELTVAAPAGKVPVALLQEGMPCQNQTVRFRTTSLSERRNLDALDAASYDHLILLADTTLPDPQQSDARTLVSLLHLRDISERAGRRLSIVTEMLDLRNRELAVVSGADDFIVSDHLVSLMLAQVAEYRQRGQIFDELFDASGSEIYLRPVGDYVTVGTPVNFYTVVASALRQGQLAIGYRLHHLADSPGARYGVHLNPNKARMVTFAEADRIIVIAPF